MPQKKHKPEEIVAKLRQVDVLLSQGRPVAEARPAPSSSAGGSTTILLHCTHLSMPLK